MAPAGHLLGGRQVVALFPRRRWRAEDLAALISARMQWARLAASRRIPGFQVVGRHLHPCGHGP
eukprot:3289354-Pyramimonas_sp.AAC.1